MRTPKRGSVPLLAVAAVLAAGPAASGAALAAGRPVPTGHPATVGASAAGGTAAAGGARGTTGGRAIAPMGGTELARPGVIVNYPSRSTARVPHVPASAFVIADADTGQILAAKQPHALYGPASTLKVLTAVSLIPVLDPRATVVATRRAVGVEPDIVGLKLGQRYRIADLFRALLMISGNDAAIALAEATGSFEKGVALMNAEARRLRANDTVARQPNGLDAPGQHVSAYDEALIARRALRMPAFLDYDETLTAWFPVTQRHRIELLNQDKLLTTYRGFIGGKTGWTTPAMAAYVGMARRDGHTLIVTVLHARPGTLFTSAGAMLDWGFAVDGKIVPVGQLVSPLPSLPSAWSPATERKSAPRLQTSSSAGVLMPFTAGCLTFAAVAFGAYGLARRRRSAR